MRPTLAVLITYHDERNLLGECLETLMSGPDIPDEIIIHDDASEAVASDYLPPGVQVSIIRATTNQGPARARNALLRASRSEYVHFHDADDWFKPDWCPRIRQLLEQSAADAVFSEVSSVYQGRPFAERVLGLHDLIRDRDLVRFCIRGSMLVPAGTYRRERVLAIGGYRERLWQAEDFDFHVRLAASGITYRIVNEPLVVIHLRAEGRSQQQVEVWSSAVQAIAHLAEELPSTYHGDLSEAAARAGSMLFRLGAAQEARRAFAVARQLGPPTFAGQSLAYQWVARTFNAEIAERTAACYRALLPHGIRARMSRA